MAAGDWDDQNPGSLRAKLEETLAENRKLQDQVSGFRVREILMEKGLDLVSPEDLKGVDLGKAEARAQEIQAERTTQQENLVKGVLRKQGYGEDELDHLVGQ